jgi:hypothetical protein
MRRRVSCQLVSSMSSILREASVIAAATTPLLQRYGGDRGGDRNYDRGGDRGGDRNYDRGGDRGDRGGERNYDRGNNNGGGRDSRDRNYDRGSDRNDRGGDRNFNRDDRSGGNYGRDNRSGGDRGGGDRNISRGGGGDRASYRDSQTSGREDRGGNFSRGNDRGAPSPSSNRGIRDAQDRISESFGDSRRGSDARPPLERIAVEVGAQKLLELKKKYRTTRLKREKSDIERDALLCLKQIRVDSSTQDEKSIAIVLNCAVFFRASKKNFAVRDGIAWNMSNLRALSPQNTAKFMHALSALASPRGGQRLQQLTEVASLIDKEYQLSAFSPVELIMMQQALTRTRITSNAQQQFKILSEIGRRVPSMATSELSTLMDIITTEEHDEVLSKEPALIASLADAVAKKLSQEGVVGAIHSNNILHYLKAFVALEKKKRYTLAADLWKALLERAIAVAKFFMDSQVGSALAVAADVKELNVATDAIAVELDSVAMARVNHIIGTFDMESSALLANGFIAARRPMPVELTDVVCKRLISEMAFQRPSLREVFNAVAALQATGCTHPQFFAAAADLIIGKRPERVTKDPNPKPAVPFEYRPDVAVDFVARRLDYCLKIRLISEEILGTRAAELMNPQISEALVEAAKKTHPIQLLESCTTIFNAKQGVPGRNRKLDEEILSIATRRISEQRALEVPARDEEGNDNGENVAKMAEAVEAFVSENSRIAGGHPLLQAVQRAASRR